jgi:hypothetical protein
MTQEAESHPTTQEAESRRAAAAELATAALPSLDDAKLVQVGDHLSVALQDGLFGADVVGLQAFEGTIKATLAWDDGDGASREILLSGEGAPLWQRVPGAPCLLHRLGKKMMGDLFRGYGVEEVDLNAAQLDVPLELKGAYGLVLGSSRFLGRGGDSGETQLTHGGKLSSALGSDAAIFAAGIQGVSCGPHMFDLFAERNKESGCIKVTHICLGVVAPMKKEGLEPLVDGAQLVGLPIGIFKSGGFGDPWVGVQNSSREYKIGDGDPPIALFGREFTNLVVRRVGGVEELERIVGHAFVRQLNAFLCKWRPLRGLAKLHELTAESNAVARLMKLAATPLPTISKLSDYGNMLAEMGAESLAFKMAFNNKLSERTETHQQVEKAYVEFTATMELLVRCVEKHPGLFHSKSPKAAALDKLRKQLLGLKPEMQSAPQRMQTKKQSGVLATSKRNEAEELEEGGGGSSSSRPQRIVAAKTKRDGVKTGETPPAKGSKSRTEDAGESVAKSKINLEDMMSMAAKREAAPASEGADLTPLAMMQEHSTEMAALRCELNKVQVELGREKATNERLSSELTWKTTQIETLQETLRETNKLRDQLREAATARAHAEASRDEKEKRIRELKHDAARLQACFLAAVKVDAGAMAAFMHTPTDD